MWGFYRRSVLRVPRIAVEAVRGVNTATGILTIVVWVAIGGTAAGAWWQFLPWQVPVTAFAVFFGYGFLRAVHEEHSEVEGERDDLKEENDAFQERAAAFREVSSVESENEQLIARIERLRGELKHMKDWNNRYHESSKANHAFIEHYKQKCRDLKEANERLKAENRDSGGESEFNT